MTSRRLPPIAVAACLVVLLAVDASACPNCKEAVAADSLGGAQGANVGGNAAAGFNNAIYFALGTLFSIVGVLGWRVGRAIRRADAAQD